MSTTLATNSATKAHSTENGTTHSPVDYVRGLSLEDKEKVLVALLREAMEGKDGYSVMSIEDEEGQPFGYYVPPTSAAPRAGGVAPKLTPEREAELARRQNEPNCMISEDEFRAWLSQADPAQNR